jgi:hypothetical protein
MLWIGPGRWKSSSNCFIVREAVTTWGLDPWVLIRDRCRSNGVGPTCWKVRFGAAPDHFQRVGAALSYLVIATRAGRDYAVALMLWTFVPPSML